MAAADFSREDGADLLSWKNSLHGEAEPWQLGPDAGLRTLRPGLASGTFTGGCLAIYAEALGTPYAPRPGLSGTDRPSILFLEDIGTKPYQWDRMLLHLRYAGLLENVTGIVFGDMRQCVPPDQEPYLDQALLHALRDFSGPIAIGLRSGHVASQNLTLPLGISAQLDLTQPENPTLHFLESAVIA
jgi:muramoyltetrapeptide carboxypeptidase